MELICVGCKARLDLVGDEVREEARAVGVGVLHALFGVGVDGKVGGVGRRRPNPLQVPRIPGVVGIADGGGDGVDEDGGGGGGVLAAETAQPGLIGRGW